MAQKSFGRAAKRARGRLCPPCGRKAAGPGAGRRMMGWGRHLRPFANQLVSGDLAATRAMLAKQDPAAAQNQQLVSQLAEMVERFGGDRYTVKGFLNGRGRDIVVQLAGRDGGSGHFAVVLDPETDQITGFVPVMLQGG